MSFLIDYQLGFILLSFALGAAGALLLVRAGRRVTSWRIADLLWVVLGGLGAITAVLTALYESDRTRIGRQIDVAFVAARTFDDDAARFRLAYCDPVAVSGTVSALCKKVEFLSASTARNSALPLFIEIARIDAPLRSLFWAGKGSAAAPDAMSEDEMRAMAETLDPDALLTFVAEDPATSAAVAALQGDLDGRRISAEFRVLADAYRDLIADVGTLRDEWARLRDNRLPLDLHVIALCMIAFAAPFRIGKSIDELL